MILIAVILVALTGVLGLLNRFEIEYPLHRRWLDPAAQRYDLPPRLLAAVVWQESRFHPTRMGQAGEIGLMQVTRAAAFEWARHENLTNVPPTALLDPVTNVLAGTWYLRRALDRWAGAEDPLACALAEYNAGHSRVHHWAAAAHSSSAGALAEAITYPGTRKYVAEILQRYHRFNPEPVVPHRHLPPDPQWPR